MVVTRIAALLVFTAMLCACSGTRPTTEGDLIPLVADHPEASLSPAWLNPKTLQIHPIIEEPEEGDMMIKGLARGWRFTPATDVIGKLHSPPETTPLTPVWLKLSDRTIHPRESGSPPEPPYLSGGFDYENGLFYPDSVTVVREGNAAPGE